MLVANEHRPNDIRVRYFVAQQSPGIGILDRRLSSGREWQVLERMHSKTGSIVVEEG